MSGIVECAQLAANSRRTPISFIFIRLRWRARAPTARPRPRDCENWYRLQKAVVLSRHALSRPVLSRTFYCVRVAHEIFCLTLLHTLNNTNSPLFCTGACRAHGLWHVRLFFKFIQDNISRSLTHSMVMINFFPKFITFGFCSQVFIICDYKRPTFQIKWMVKFWLVANAAMYIFYQYVWPQDFTFI